MGNSELLYPAEGGIHSRNPLSPKLISGTMSQKSTSPPKSPKTPDDNLKSDGFSSPPKSGRSPSSSKSSPGSTKSMSIAERLAQSTRGKTNPALKSPGSKSPPTTPNSLTSFKSDPPKESTDPCLKLNETEKTNVVNGSAEVKMENSQLSNGEQSVIVKNVTTSELSDIKQDDVSVESIQVGIKDDAALNEVKESETLKNVTNEIAIDEVDNSTKPLFIENDVILELTTKKDIRQKVWEFLEVNSLVVFPKPCFNRIPNFKGCINATQTLEKMEEFKKAKTVQVTPDKAQETARFLTLSWGKRLLVPLLRLKEGLLQSVSLPFAEPSIKMLRSASTQKGLRKWGNKLITSGQNNADHHVDMVILGSVAVDKKGRRIGIGNGYSDLEFVILSSMNMVTDKTLVVTIVHDVQVFDTLPVDVFKPYDVPVDIIITPKEIIRIENRLDRPKEIFWNYISKRRLLEMPPLQLLRQQQVDCNIDCTLKEVDSEPEEIPPSPKTFKKSKKYRPRRSYSTRSETNDSVFKDTEVSKHRSSSKPSSAPGSKNMKSSKDNRKRAKSTSSQQRSSSTVGRPNNSDDQKDRRRSNSKKPNKRRTKSESAKTSPITDSKNTNGQQTDSPKNKRKSRQKPQQRVHSDDIDKQSIRNTKINGSKKSFSRSNSRVARRDYIDRQDIGREISSGGNNNREFIPSPKKYYSQTRHNSYSQERQSRGNFRSNSRVYRRDSSRPVMQQNGYSNGPIVRQTRYFNGQTARQNNFNGPISRQNYFNGPVSRQNGGNNYQIVRHNSFSNDSLPRPRQNYYDGVVSRRNSFSKPAVHHENYTNTRVFRQPQHEREFAKESRPRYNNDRVGYFNSNEKPNYSRSINGDEFVLKVGNIANNVRVRDLKAALMERGVKPLHITWRGPRGFAYLRYGNSADVNKDNVIGSLQNVRIKPNGVETAQTQTLIVTECQFS